MAKRSFDNVTGGYPPVTTSYGSAYGSATSAQLNPALFGSVPLNAGPYLTRAQYTPGGQLSGVSIPYGLPAPSSNQRSELVSTSIYALLEDGKQLITVGDLIFASASTRPGAARNHMRRRYGTGGGRTAVIDSVRSNEGKFFNLAYANKLLYDASAQRHAAVARDQGLFYPELALTVQECEDIALPCGIVSAVDESAISGHASSGTTDFLPDYYPAPGMPNDTAVPVTCTSEGLVPARDVWWEHIHKGDQLILALRNVFVPDTTKYQIYPGGPAADASASHRALPSAKRGFLADSPTQALLTYLSTFGSADTELPARQDLVDLIDKLQQGFTPEVDANSLDKDLRDAEATLAQVKRALEDAEELRDQVDDDALDAAENNVAAAKKVVEDADDAVAKAKRRFTKFGKLQALQFLRARCLQRDTTRGVYPHGHADISLFAPTTPGIWVPQYVPLVRTTTTRPRGLIGTGIMQHLNCHNSKTGAAEVKLVLYGAEYAIGTVEEGPDHYDIDKRADALTRNYAASQLSARPNSSLLIYTTMYKPPISRFELLRAAGM